MFLGLQPSSAAAKRGLKPCAVSRVLGPHRSITGFIAPGVVRAFVFDCSRGEVAGRLRDKSVFAARFLA